MCLRAADRCAVVRVYAIVRCAGKARLCLISILGSPCRHVGVVCESVTAVGVCYVGAGSLLRFMGVARLDWRGALNIPARGPCRVFRGVLSSECSM